ncbi:MAG TPA: hypothetical protein VGN97_08955 [Mesorhizobium sp.]|jgi:hypothetical protein|nr:hypothetical protein [Mesorhizobium sp.]
MDWSYAIERNRDALKRVLAALVAMAGLAGAAAFTSPLRGGRSRNASGWGRQIVEDPTRHPSTSSGCRPPLKGEVARPTLPRHLHRAVLRLLRPAESAARRLVIVAARGLVVPPARPRVRKTKLTPLPARYGTVTGIWMPPGFSHQPSARPGAPERPSRGRKPCLPLFDRLPRLGPPARPAPRGIPRLCVPGLSAPLPVPLRRPLSPDDMIDAARLQGRLAALAWALDDLPGQARRYARWRMRVANAAVGGEAQTPRPVPRRLSPLKPGRPPGLARRSAHDIHEILRNAHSLALGALDGFDTS